MASSEKLDVLGMLWYHGSKSQKEAESSLESCSGENLYIVREHQGSLYLSAHHGGMYHHIPITHTQHGYILDGHYNAFKTLRELVSHHQRHSVYVEGGEFTLQVCCHKEFSAIASKFINDFRGPCSIRVGEDNIAIKKSNGKEVGKWPYVFIRVFRFDDEKLQFSFQSGRRGPFGVAEYTFKLHDRTFFNLRETVNRIAQSATVDDYKPPVPAHGRSLVHKQLEVLENEFKGMKISRNNRRTSNPDLSREALAKFTKGNFNSTKSNPSAPGSPKLNLKECQSPSSTSLNTIYQVPRPATERIYSTPRPMDDPRNDYHIPKPMNETYMVPSDLSQCQPHASNESCLLLKQSDQKRNHEDIIEHSYEDPENGREKK